MPKIIIIGAGIAGLSAGVYARKNGFQAEIFEMHSQPGGFCTAWKRKGYTFDGCLHWLTGSGPASSFFQLWKELGALDGRQFFDHEVFQSYQADGGRIFNLYTNVDRLLEHMLEIAPEDEVLTREFCGWIRKFTRFDSPMDKAFEMFGFFDILRMMVRMAPYMRDYKTLSNISVGEYADRFGNAAIREGLELVFGTGDYPLSSLIMTMSLLHNRAGGFPLGGSLEFARSIGKRFLELGGVVHYNKKVDKILVTGDAVTGDAVTSDAVTSEKSGTLKAFGVRLSDGSEVKADYVISATDLKSTVYHMLDGRFIEPQHEELFRQVPLAPSSVMVYFGLKRKFTPGFDSSAYVFHPSRPVMIGKAGHDRITERNYNYDPSLAPEGGSVICSMFVDNDFEYWENLRMDKTEYNEVKKRILQSVTEAFEERYPGFTAAIEATDVVTPMTFHRYTGSWHGTYMTWILKGDNTNKFRMVKKTLPGLDNFWLSGQWVMPPGGVPTGAKTSRDIIQVICKQEKRRFMIDD